MWLKAFYLIVASLVLSHGYTRLLNMKCKVLNRTRIDIKECSLKDMSGGILSANIQLKVHQPPDPNWMVTFGVWKDMGGYKPFFYNVSFDFCGFLKNPNRLQIYYLFHKAILPFSNLNQSCPFLVSG